MLNRIKKNYFEKIFSNQKFLTLIGLIIIILISWPFTKNAIKQYKINKEINDFKEEIANLQNKNTDLKKFVSYLESDQFAEGQARLNLNLKKSGEELTVIKTDVLGLVLASSSESNPIFNIPGREKEVSLLEIANPKKWLDYFFRK